MKSIRKILIPLVDPFRADPYLKLGAALLPPDGRILALKIVEVPEDESLSIGAEKAPVYRAALGELSAQSADDRVELRTLVRVSHRLSEGIATTAKEEGCDLLILPWKGYTSSQDRFFGTTIDQLLEHPPCPVMIVRATDLSGCRRFLLPIRGGPYAELSLEIAAQMASAVHGEVTVLHCEEGSTLGDSRDRLYRSFLRKLRSHAGVKRFLSIRGDPKSVIIEEAMRHDLVIVGAGGSPESQSSFLGPIVEHIAGGMEKPLLVVKTPEPFPVWRGGDLWEKPQPLSQRVDKWFAENTFHAREFSDFQKLVELKEKQGLTISLGLPALNEAETVGAIIQTMKQSLLERVPLLNEIVLIDSGSTDDTVKIARDLGIEVYLHPEILPQYGSYRGKGEALWKSLHVLRGDLIVWIDTDIRNIHPGFVYGVVGPLLKDPEIQYVKGYYRRPVRVDGKIHAEGGGRVTELTARPFFNLFFPELSGILQPLSGEYAGRREAFERVPFFTGYGVETGLLIDLFNEFGLRALAQVDLEERIHRNQSLSSLSQMAFAIIQVFIQRLEERNMIKLLEDVNRSMKLIKHRRRSYALEVKEIQDQQRPPMISVPEYRAKRQKSKPPKNEQGH